MHCNVRKLFFRLSNLPLFDERKLCILHGRKRNTCYEKYCHATNAEQTNHFVDEIKRIAEKNKVLYFLLSFDLRISSCFDSMVTCLSSVFHVFHFILFYDFFRGSEEVAQKKWIKQNHFCGLANCVQTKIMEHEKAATTDRNVIILVRQFSLRDADARRSKKFIFCRYDNRIEWMLIRFVCNATKIVKCQLCEAIRRPRCHIDMRRFSFGLWFSFFVDGSRFSVFYLLQNCLKLCSQVKQTQFYAFVKSSVHIFREPNEHIDWRRLAIDWIVTFSARSFNYELKINLFAMIADIVDFITS